MNKLRYGLVAAGTIARVHAKALAARPDVELAAASDVSEKTLAATCEQFGIPARYADYKEMFKKENLDVAIVCTPNAFHCDAVLAALKAGCHVMCEKPPAVSVKEARKMADAAVQAGKRLFYGVHMRFEPAVETARAYLDSGRLGEVYHASVHMFRRRGIPGLGSWFTTKAISGGGALIDIGVHMLDRAHYLMGLPKPVSVSAATHAKFGCDPESYNYISMWGTPVKGGVFDVDDLAAAFVRFDNGASLVLQVSWAANTEQSQETRIMGTKGGIQFAGNDLKIVTEDNGFISDIVPQFKPGDVRAKQHAHLIECIRDPKKPLRTDHAHGIVLQSMLDAIYESAKTGKQVNL